MLPHKLLETRLQQALRELVPDAEVRAVRVQPCANPAHGDFQCSALIGIAKQLRRNPRQFSAEVASKLTQLCRGAPLNFEAGLSYEIAGAGFLNFRIAPAALASILHAAARGEHLFFERTDKPRTIVIDFSSPNVAKPMHVGHIRSTILGDSLARTFRQLGHHVITDNHLGDWGTQFGKLLVGWKRHLDRESLKQDPIGEMERLYRLVNQACENDPAALDEARGELVKLQNGDPQNAEIWREMIALSQTQFDTIYRRLGVRFEHTLGESFYNPRLKDVVRTLTEKGIARESEGAMVVFFAGHPELRDHPALIRKRDGAANYTTTDLATLEYRLQTWQPDEIVYVTDGRQQLHFKQVFEVFRRWHPDAHVKLAHVWFGSILGEDGKPFKTRSGETIRLSDLLDEAEERAFRIVSEKNPDLSEADRRGIARVVGLGAVKYADLLPNRQSDYVFSWDRMLALQGNTAPYLQYAYTRIRSIFRKGGLPGSEAKGASAGTVHLVAPEEIALARHLLNFGLVLESVGDDYRPNYLCNYLYELAGHFTQFYENCPVLKAEAGVRASRLVLCDLTARVLKQGLEVLGIETLEHM